MTDVLYSVGPGGGARGDNQELRWSLRSVEKFARNVGRVIVAGYPPDWLSDEVVKFPVERDPNKSHFANIWDCVMAAIEAGVVKGEFLYSSDDHFLTYPWDFDSIPFYARVRGAFEIPDYAHARGGENNRRMLDQTRRVLLGNGYSIVRSNTHKNTVLDTADAPEAKRLAALAPDKRVGLELTCVFQNVHMASRGTGLRRCWVPTRDWKIGSFDQRAINSGAFSIRDSVFDDPAFTVFMRGAFGVPSKYER